MYSPQTIENFENVKFFFLRQQHQSNWAFAHGHRIIIDFKDKESLVNLPKHTINSTRIQKVLHSKKKIKLIIESSINVNTYIKDINSQKNPSKFNLSSIYIPTNNVHDL
jgi:hypothetical protein